jgi:prolyl oligopeptidase
LWSGGRLVLSYLDDLRPVTELLTPGTGEWRRQRLAGLPEHGVAHVWSLDMEEEESTGELLANTQDPLTPASFFLIEPGKAPELLKRAPRTFDADGLRVTRHDAVSIDGTKIPYFQIGPAGEAGEAPVHLYGYGGFNISQLPHYGSAIGKLWLE